MSRGDRGWRHRASAVSSFKSVFASSNSSSSERCDSRSESAHCQMKAAGMVPLTVNAADMEALVSYVTSPGETSAAPAATPRLLDRLHLRQPQQDHLRQPDHRKHQLEV
jgi:hypothetical protein